jgi:outer membrane scaffolding protein for murein synthesis (MipA/OmpV family)
MPSLHSPRRPLAAWPAAVLAFGALGLLAPLAPRAQAAQKPLWEFGMGLGGVVFQDYRGAASSHFYPLPVPYFIYRGRFFRADRNGMRGRLLHQSRIALNLSVNATTPVHNNTARSGMPDLRSTVEIGPSLVVHLWRSAHGRARLDLALPVRAAFTVEASPKAIGWLATPGLNLDLPPPRGLRGWNVGLFAGPLIVGRRYAGYFYTVAPRYATPVRPAYSAPGGYAGSELLASLSKRYPSFWIGAFVRYDSLAGASFEASPLVKRSSYFAAGFGVAWIIRDSRKWVESSR